MKKEKSHEPLEKPCRAVGRAEPPRQQTSMERHQPREHFPRFHTNEAGRSSRHINHSLAYASLAHRPRPIPQATTQRMRQPGMVTIGRLVLLPRTPRSLSCMLALSNRQEIFGVMFRSSSNNSSTIQRPFSRVHAASSRVAWARPDLRRPTTTS
jgi:hypothetical protein